MLGKKKVDVFRTRLLDLKKKIGKELEEKERETLEKTLKEASGELSSYSIHLADLGSDASERDKEIDILETEERILDRIERALRKIEEGSYGICEDCGKEIPPERLEAIPYALKCRECQEREEKEAR